VAIPVFVVAITVRVQSREVAKGTGWRAQINLCRISRRRSVWPCMKAAEPLIINDVLVAQAARGVISAILLYSIKALGMSPRPRRRVGCGCPGALVGT
jgi:hypothetical protein